MPVSLGRWGQKTTRGGWALTIGGGDEWGAATPGLMRNKKGKKKKGQGGPGAGGKEGSRGAMVGGGLNQLLGGGEHARRSKEGVKGKEPSRWNSKGIQR